VTASGDFHGDYFTNIFTVKTWNEFVAAGSSTSGFLEQRRKAAEKIKPGDRFLCYLARVSRFIAVLEVAARASLRPTPVCWPTREPQGRFLERR